MSDTPPKPAEPVSPPVPVEQTVDLSPDRKILVPTSDGALKEVTLQEMADAWKNSSSVTPQDVEELGLFRKVMANDPVAIRTLMDKLAPVPAPLPAAPEIDSRFQKLEDMINQKLSVFDDLRNNSVHQGLANYAKANEATFPALAKNPDSGRVIKRNLDSLLSARGLVFEKLAPNHQLQAIQMAINESEQAQRAFLAPYGITFDKKPETPPSNQPVNDQGSKVIPPMYQVDRFGNMIDTRTGKTIMGRGGTIPSDIIQQTPSGSGPVNGQSNQTKSFTVEDLKADIRARVANR